jgi:hypothetical protein
MSWTPTKSMPPSPRLTRLKGMRYNEFIALDPGLLRHRSSQISRRHRQAAPGADASAIQGRLSAQVALLQSLILPAAPSPYSKEEVFRSLPVDNTHTCLRGAEGVAAGLKGAGTGRGRGFARANGSGGFGGRAGERDGSQGGVTGALGRKLAADKFHLIGCPGAKELCREA